MTLPIGKLPRNFPAVVSAAIFDFDETMIDLEAQHTFASEALCRRMGSDYAALPEEWRHGSGRRVLDDVRDLRSFFGWTAGEEELFAIRQRFFDEACASGELTLMPGVERTVRRLHEAGIHLAITSSSVRSAIVAILRRFALADLFEVIVDGSEVRRGKPDPEAYELTARRLGVAKEECIVFEDSSVGVAAAKAAGIFVVAVRNPRALSVQDLSAADGVIASFEELLEREAGGGKPEAGSRKL
ncbi:MAG TPA: HAD family phosphatase [Thermoanaerobaculia bacterium]|nr:HAD family phosphatase [Thermoanaerobaculia bacterium]